MRPNVNARFLRHISLLFIVVLTGCTSRTQEIRIWTDRIELVTHAELFNAEDRGFYAVVEYVASPAEALARRADRPDVIVADYLGSSETMDELLVLDRRFRRFAPDAQDVYEGLLSHGRLRGRQRLYPISFDLPGVLALSETAKDLPDFMVDIEELRQRGGAFNQTESERLTRVGYSPRWSQEFLYTLVRMLGVRFAEGSEGLPEWDQLRLRSALESARSWVEETNQGLEAELMFQEQFLYDPMPQLVLRGRILFSYTRASDFFSMPETRRRSFDVRWLSREGQIPVLESMVFAGVVADSRHKQASLDFVAWLASAETHRKILLNAEKRRLGSFGVLGGFSAHRRINEWVLPNLYPSILGIVPPAEALAFAEGIPRGWEPLKTEVVEPWLSRAVDRRPSLRPLDNLIQAWMLQRGD
jgi:hypothetical protein